MRTCIYEQGEIVEVPSIPGCIDPLYEGNPLIDWSDSVDVTTAPPINWLPYAIAGAVLLVMWGGRR